MTTHFQTTNCQFCGGKIASWELAPGAFLDECKECGEQPADHEPNEFIHPGAGVMCEGLIEHELKNII